MNGQTRQECKRKDAPDRFSLPKVFHPKSFEMNTHIQLKPEGQAKLLDCIESASNADLFNQTPVLEEMYNGFINSKGYQEMTSQRKKLVYEAYNDIRKFMDEVGDIMIREATRDFHPLPR
jgi:hypothetical protein